MDYCTAHFGKQLSELTYEDIETYFQKENTETDQLEFKSNSKGNLDDRLKSIQKIVYFFESQEVFVNLGYTRNNND